MSEKHYMQNMQILGMDTEEDNKRYYNAVISSTSLNHKHFRISLATLRDLRRQANSSNIPVYFDHETWEKPSGRSVSAKLSDDQLFATFYLLTELPDTESDLVIKRLDSGTMTDMSIGFEYTEESKLMCDICRDEMLDDEYWYYRRRCKEGHYPGKKIKLKGKDVYVTATVEGKVRLREYSVVGIGCDPSAKIVESLQEGLSDNRLSLSELSFIAECGNLNYNQFCETLGVDTAKFGSKRRSVSLPNSSTTRRQLMPKETETAKGSKLNEIADSQLEKHLDAANETIERLESELDASYSSEEYKSLQDELTELKQSLVNEDSVLLLAKQGEIALKWAREDAEEAYISMRGTELEDDSDPELIDVQNELAECKSFNEIRRSARKFWKDSRRSKSGGRKTLSDPYGEYSGRNRRPENYTDPRALG